MLTAAWLFVRHGKPRRARVLMEVLVEDDPRDGVSAAALAELLLSDGEGDAVFPADRLMEASAGIPQSVSQRTVTR